MECGKKVVFMVDGGDGMGERKSFLWWMAGMGWGKKVVLRRVGGKGMVERKSFG